ncbi:hypothetical protein [Microbacterium pumilum]|uniref:hypothetical protein n=1 Tax=Microbacterium pumilum TaxID=344165 RepID=UPI0031E3CAEF
MHHLATPAFAVALALVFVAAVVGTVAVTVLGLRNQVASVPDGDTPYVTVDPPTGGVAPTLLPGVPVPAPGAHAALAQDPALTWESLHGALLWVEGQRLDYTSLQGFQRLDAVQPWTAEKLDGGTCILLRTDDGSGFDQMACDSDGLPATVDRTLNGAVLRFTLKGEVIDVYVTSP